LSVGKGAGPARPSARRDGVQAPHGGATSGLVEQSPVSVYLDQLHEISFADLSREILAMSVRLRLTKSPGLQPQAEAEWEQGAEALGPLGGRVDER
jgi:hypothetical protein